MIEKIPRCPQCLAMPEGIWQGPAVMECCSCNLWYEMRSVSDHMWSMLKIDLLKDTDRDYLIVLEDDQYSGGKSARVVRHGCTHTGLWGWLNSKKSNDEELKERARAVIASKPGCLSHIDWRKVNVHIIRLVPFAGMWAGPWNE